MKYIPYGHQWIDKSDIKEVIKVLKSGWVTQGPNIARFENALCKYTGAKYAVAVSNGTASLHIACLSAGIKSGDEVITSPITFLASANCVLYCGGRPVFADVDRTTANIEASQITRHITDKTKALIPVHYSGQPCDMEKIRNIARENNLLVIEDAAHALGAKYKDTKVGSCKYSDMTILSFHPVKHITTGEGGAVLTNNEKLYKKLIKFRNHGISQTDYLNEPHGKWYYEMQYLGFNYRITDMQAALGLSQLKKLNRFVSRRREIVKKYKNAFKNNEYFDIPEEEDYAFSSYHLYPIRLKDKFVNRKKDIFSIMREKGLGVQVHYIPLYKQPYYQSIGFKDKICPNAEDFYKREISLPIYPKMNNSDINFVIKTIFKIFKNI